MKPYRNFTLIEVLVVMMIFTLIVGIAVGAMRKIPALVSLRQVVSELKQQCAESRRTASGQRRNLTIWYDPETGCIHSEEAEILLPDDLAIRIGQTDIRQENKKHDLFVLFPDGSGQNQRLELVLGSDSVIVTLSPLTGRIYSEDGKAN